MTTNGNSPAKKDYSYLWKHEDYWAIWMGLTILIIGLFVFFSSTPANMESTIAKSNAVMAAEAKKAPFKTLEWYQASDAKSSLSGANIPFAKTFSAYASRPKGWSDNPMASFYLSEADAKAKSAAAAGRYDTAKKATVAALADAKTAQAAAATAQFKDAALNKAASDKVENWRKARTAESRAKGAAETKPYNLIPGMIVMIIGLVELVTLLNSGFSSGVANLAHLGGLVAGFLALKYWTDWKHKQRGPKNPLSRGRKLKLVVDNEREDNKTGPRYWN